MRHASCILMVLLFSPLVATGQEKPAKDDPTDDQTEVHVVSIYEGVYKTNGKLHGGRASVTVDRSDKRVILVLLSYEPVTWSVSVAGKSQVERVILGGYHRQAVTGLPEDVDVVEAFRQEGKAIRPLYGPYKFDSAELRPMVRAIYERTKREIRSFQGTYRPEPGARFLVDAVDDDPRLRSDYPKPAPLAELPKLEFEALHFSGKDRHEQMASIGRFTLSGPKIDSLKPLPNNVIRWAFDPVAKQAYGLMWHSLVEIDGDLKKTRTVDVGLDVPPLSWPCGITFDTKRQRLIVVSLGGEGIMYAFTPKTGKWSALAELDNIDLAALTYHEKDDCFYGLGPGPFTDEDRDVARIYKYNEEGALLENYELREPFPRVMASRAPSDAPIQIVAADKYLVILVPRLTDEHGQEFPESYIYLLDLKAGKLWLTHKESQAEKSD